MQREETQQKARKEARRRARGQRHGAPRGNGRPAKEAGAAGSKSTGACVRAGGAAIPQLLTVLRVLALRLAEHERLVLLGAALEDQAVAGVEVSLQR